MRHLGARLLSCALAAATAACASAPRVTVSPRPQAAGSRFKVAILPFDNKSGVAEPVGETAAAFFTQELLKFPTYRVIGETIAERSVRVESTVESDPHEANRRKERVEVLATEKGTDPIAWGRKLGVDAVLAGSVTEYRHRQAFILPPARVGIEVRMIHIPTRQVLWSASDSRGYPPWRWLTLIAWPLGVTLAFFSPPAELRLKQSIAITAAAIQEELSWVGPARD